MKSKIKIYKTHDNGGRPFIVHVKPSRVIVYDTKYDESNDDIIKNKKVLNIKYKKVFIGDNYLDNHYYTPKGMFEGNSIVVKIGLGKYVFIGNTIDIFKTIDNDEIVEYYSPVGNNDVPYPYAVGKNNTYFMLDGQYVANELLDLEKDGYEQFYDKISDEDKKSYKTTKVIHYGFFQEEFLLRKKFEKDLSIVTLPEFININYEKDFPYKENPSKTFFEKLQSFFGLYVDNDNKKYIPYREKIIKFINNNLIDEDRKIKLGTKLYYGTIESELDTKYLENKLIFVGLEPSIVMWQLYKEKDKNDLSYIYELEVVKPITVDKIINFITNNASDDDVCKIYSNVCSKPSITIRNNIYDLSIEMTMPLKKLLDENYIKIINRYKTNIKNLEKFHSIPMKQLKLYKYKDLLFFYDNYGFPGKYLNSIL